MNSVTATNPPELAQASPLSGTCRGLSRWEPALFLGLIAIHLAPIWMFTYLPTTDGAAHVASADVMRRYHDPGLDVFRKYYFVSGAPVPNLIGHVLLAGFLSLVKPVVAEKLLVSLYLVLFPLGLRYAASALGRRAGLLGYLAFPMCYSFLLGQGFYNFCLSLGVFLVVVGYWVRIRDRLGPWRGILLAVLLAVLYTCHLFSLMMACGTVALLAGWLWLSQWWQGGGIRGAGLRRLAITAAAMAPVTMMALLYKPVTRGFEYKADDQWSIKGDIASLLQFTTMVSYRKNEAILGGAVVAVIGALALWAAYVKITRKVWRPADVLLLIPLGLLGLYFKAHDGNSIHFYVPQRAMFYLFLTLILWLAAQPLTARVRAGAAGMAALIALAMLASHALKYREFAPQLAEFVGAGEQIQPNTTFLPLIFAPQGRGAMAKPTSVDVAPFYMASGYIAVARQSVDLRNYEAKTDHFPVRFRPELNPYLHLAVEDGLDRIPPRIDLAKYEGLGGRVDYVLIWGIDDTQRRLPETAELFKQLGERYERLELPNARWTQLWRRK